MAIQKLLFVDTNIWLDFYRARSDAGLSLLDRLEGVSDKLIVSYQLEMEYKKNRQIAIIEGINGLKKPEGISRPPFLSDAASMKAIQKSIKDTSKRIGKLKDKLIRALQDPSKNDPVYKACQRIFHNDDSNLILNRENPIRHKIKRRALKRFLLGCPPRKGSDTSMGDAVNWEWMIECAIQNKAELVIVTRDSDYGVHFDGESYVNDHLGQEFSERVSKKRQILLYSKLSSALKHFSVSVSKQIEDAEDLIIKLSAENEKRGIKAPDINDYSADIMELLGEP